MAKFVRNEPTFELVRTLPEFQGLDDPAISYISWLLSTSRYEFVETIMVVLFVAKIDWSRLRWLGAAQCDILNSWLGFEMDFSDGKNYIVTRA